MISSVLIYRSVARRESERFFCLWCEINLLGVTGLFIINGGRNSYDPVEILAKKLRKLNETNILVITILESQKLS